ncbi:LLM class flavin-dependent oxidoreductase [Actinosynnema sp. CS-041913]|uniref:LLM class flavin-dependent oxidoreductase n=1 Tax=Actinosynnema sp. CS-041913 TaxID=3239917 RepID=UPI003D8FD31E
MDIGLGLPTTVPGADGRDLLEFARRADAAGFSTLAVLDRLVYDSYDSVVALAAAAGATTRIRLATTVLLAAYRPSAVELAKQLASLDKLSAGRLVLGVAAGGREDDFHATGVDYRTRGRRLDALLDQLDEVWRGGGATPGVGPRPSTGSVPLWVGGHSPAALRRAAKYGSGWISPGGSVTAYPDLVQRTKEFWAREGRVDVPRMIALGYVSLGADGRRRAGEYLRDYYSYRGDKADRLVDSVVTDAAALREIVDGHAAGGCDELLLFSCTDDPDHVDRIAEVVEPC